MKTLNTTLCISLLLISINSIAQEVNEPRVLFEISGMTEAQVRTDIAYVESGDSSLVMDIYYPANFDFNTRIPAIIIAYGYSNRAQHKSIGKPFMKWEWYTSWSKLISAKGIAAIVYETNSPEEDLKSIQTYISSNASQLNIDVSKIGLFSVSGNTSVAIEALLDAENGFYKCGALYYPFILTKKSEYIDAAKSVSSQYGFTLLQLNDKKEWSSNTPLFIVQAGKDEITKIKELTGEFINMAHQMNLPLTFINYNNGIHGFDAFQDNDSTKRIINSTLNFWSFHLKSN